MKRSLKVMLLVHPQMRPDRKKARGRTESDVWAVLKRLGYQVEIAPLQDDLPGFERTLVKTKPDVVFNLLEEFRDEGVFDFHAISYLEALGIPFTGCNPRGLIVSRNKIWAAQIARGSGLRSPEVFVDDKKVRYPAFVKYVREHASRGLTERNRVSSARTLSDVRKTMRQKFAGEILVQEFVAGEDVTVSVLGDKKPVVFSPWRLNLKSKEAFATERIKFSAKSRLQKGIRAYRYAKEDADELRRSARRLYEIFDLSGYARLDFRVTSEGEAYFIDVNANPNLAKDEDFAVSARFADWQYPDLIREILRLAIDYKPRV